MTTDVSSGTPLAEIVRTGIPGYNPFDCDPALYRFDEQLAQRAVDFFPACLTHVKGSLAGKPFELARYQIPVVAAAFGFVRVDDGMRRFQRVFIYVPRKNGKTTLCAGLVLYATFCDNEPGAEVYSAAADRDQAAIVFGIAKQMVLNHPELTKRARVYQRSIVYQPMQAVYKPISAEASTKHGYNTSFAVVDELHAQKNRELTDVMETSTGARDQPMIVFITTADYDRPSICNEKLDYAKKVRDGVIPDEEFMPVIYEAEKDDDWTAEDTWLKSNPCLGLSVSRRYIAKECLRAQEDPLFENTFKRLHLNMKTEQAVRLIQMERWDACCQKPVDEDALAGQPCWGGIDLSTTIDLSAIVWVFPTPDEDGDEDSEQSYIVVPRLFVPAENIDARMRRDRVPYPTWAQQGHIIATPGNSIDYRYMRKIINEDADKFSVQEIGFDPYNASHLVTELGEEDGFEMVQVRQGMLTMSPPTKELLRLLRVERLLLGNNPVMRWNAANISGKTDEADNVKPDKKTSTERIDGVVALIIALSLVIASPGSADSIYDDRGVMSIDLDEDDEDRDEAGDEDSDEDSFEAGDSGEVQR